MKTIELMISGQKAQFTTKSVTIEGKEYFYSDITQLDHSPVVRTYRIECNGETKLLTYEKKDAKILAAIFSQVDKMLAMKKAKAAETADKAKNEQKSEAPAVEKAVTEEPKAEESPAEESPAEEQKEEEQKEEENPAEETKAEEISAEETKSEEKEEKAEEENKSKKSIKDFFAPLKKNNEDGNSEKTEGEEKEPMDPEKKARLVKSLKVFGIILGVIIALSVVYYFVFGTNNAPSDTNPNYNESQQYDDIDQLIDDLQ